MFLHFKSLFLREVFNCQSSWWGNWNITYLNLCLQMRINNAGKYGICLIGSNYGLVSLVGTFGTEFLSKAYVFESLLFFR